MHLHPSEASKPHGDRPLRTGRTRSPVCTKPRRGCTSSSPHPDLHQVPRDTVSRLSLAPDAQTVPNTGSTDAAFRMTTCPLAASRTWASHARRPGARLVVRSAWTSAQPLFTDITFEQAHPRRRRTAGPCRERSLARIDHRSRSSGSRPAARQAASLPHRLRASDGMGVVLHAREK